MNSAVSHQEGRQLTGLTFGKRGAGVFARIYDKTAEAAPDAPIRSRWAATLGRPLDPSATVWRIEFELRRDYLRTIRTAAAPSDATGVGEGDRLGTLRPSARVLLEQELDRIWADLTTRWLVLRDRSSASRLDRRRPQAWWESLSSIGGLTTVPSDGVALTRRTNVSARVEPVLQQLAGLLAALGARRGDNGLESCLDAFASYMWQAHGPDGFAGKVRRSARRLPGAAVTRHEADIRRQISPDGTNPDVPDRGTPIAWNVFATHAEASGVDAPPNWLKPPPTGQAETGSNPD